MKRQIIEAEEVLQAILDNLVGLTESKEDLIKLWFYLGRLMGIENIFPELQVVVTQDDNEERQPVLMIGTLSPVVLELLTNTDILTEDIAQLCLQVIKDQEAKTRGH